MQIRLLTDLSDEARSYGAGDVLELTPERAELWIRAGYAEPLEAAAVADSGLERAVEPRAKKRG
jgi:hypothetical protein